MKKIVLILIIMLNAFKSYNQTGSPYITNYPMDEHFNYKVWDILQLPDREMLLLCRNGLITYNGATWQLHSLSAAPLTIKSGHQHRIFAGLKGDFGTIEADSSGTYQFRSLKPQDFVTDDIFDRIIQADDRIFIVGDKHIFAIDTLNQAEEISFPHFIKFNGVFIHQKKLHIYSASGIYRIHEDSLGLFANVTLPENTSIIFHCTSPTGTTYIGGSDNRLYKYKGEEFVHIPLKNQTYLDETILLDGILINDTLMTLSTNIGGILLVNIQTGKTVNTINYTTGLPDDEIYDIYKDRHNGLWIAHSRGISRIGFALPIRLFNKYPGITGNLYAFEQYNNQIYLGSGRGLYYLTKHKAYKSKHIRVKVKPELRKPEPAKQKKETTAEDEPEKKEKKGRLRRFFKRVAEKIKQPIQKITKSEPEPEEKIVTKETKPQSVYETKTIYKLQSVSHRFEEVKGFKGKCFQLLKFKDQLIAASNTGLYAIKDHKATQILSEAYVNHIIPSRYDSQKLYAATTEGVAIMQFDDFRWKLDTAYTINEEIRSVAELDSTQIWLGSMGNAYQIQTEGIDSVRLFSFPHNMLDEVVVRYMKDSIYFILNSGLYRYNLAKDTIVPIRHFFDNPAQDIQTIYSQPRYTWINADGWERYNWYGKQTPHATRYLKLLESLDNIVTDTVGNIWAIDIYNDLYKISAPPDSLYIPDFKINVDYIRHKGGAFITADDILLDYKENAIDVQVSSPFFLKAHSVKYQYKLSGLMDRWSKWRQNATISFPFIPPGTYDLLIKSKTILGNTSEVIKIPVIVEKPFRQTIAFFIIVGVIVVLLVLVIIKLRERKLKHDKAVLEAKVKARTKTISEQKEEITAQRDTLAGQNEEILQQKEEITAQRDEIEAQKTRIETQHNDIKKSITYAERIQAAVLPAQNLIDGWLPNYFILFKPRDIVSGDFFWINKIAEKIIVVVADCTGHGVPGAFMSMLGVSFLNEIAAKTPEPHANIILNELRNYVKNTLSQQGKQDEAKDGMDISLMVLDFANAQAEFAGAFNSLYMIREGELTEIKADKMPVGIYLKEKASFSNNIIDLKKGDTFYMLSDGFPDQFGGSHGRKFMRKPFKRLLLNMQDQTMADQQKTLEKTFREWLGSKYHQTDDVLVMGIKI